MRLYQLLLKRHSIKYEPTKNLEGKYTVTTPQTPPTLNINMDHFVFYYLLAFKALVVILPILMTFPKMIIRLY